MDYGKKLDNLNLLIKVVIKLKNKFYELAMKTHYSNSNNKAKF